MQIHIHGFYECGEGVLWSGQHGNGAMLKMYTVDGVLSKVVKSFFERVRQNEGVLRGRREFVCENGLEAEIPDAAMTIKLFIDGTSRE